MQILKHQYFVTKPWKNGQGTTQEILVYPNEDFIFRLSMADIKQSGPFSLFPGIQRSLVLIEGKSVTLNSRQLELLTPFEFDGETEIHCSIQSEGKDFNLMWRKNDAQGKLTYHHHTSPFQLSLQSNFSGIFCLKGELTVEGQSLSKYDLGFFTTPKTLEVKGEFLLIEIDSLQLKDVRISSSLP